MSAQASLQQERIIFCVLEGDIGKNHFEHSYSTHNNSIFTFLKKQSNLMGDWELMG